MMLKLFTFGWTSSVLLLAILFLISCVEGNTLLRVKRQSAVSSAGNVNGTGTLNLAGAGTVYKTIDGVVGANGTSVGNATGNGTSSILSNSYGNVGTKTAQALGTVVGKGDNTKTSALTYAGIDGNNTNIQNRESGSASGQGKTEVKANGNAYMANGNMTSLYNGNQTMGMVGATGDKASSSSLAISQSLSWGTILAQLLGTAVSQGVFNASAHVNLGAGSASNGIEINGQVSGKSSGGGLVSAQVNGAGNLMGANHSMTGDLAGAVNGMGSSSLMGASNLQSNGSTNNATIDTFGDAIINTDGRSSLGMLGNSSVGIGGQTNSQLIIQGSASGANKNMSVNDGLLSSNGQNKSTVQGISNIMGKGNVVSNATSLVDSKYTGNLAGNNNGSEIRVGASGNSAAVNKTQAALTVNNIGQFIGNSKNSSIVSMTNASGMVNADSSNVTGNSFLNLNGLSQSGNSSMMAVGGGKGNSNAQTGTLLNLVDMNNQKRNTSINGLVSAIGDMTSVQSLSMVSDMGLGKQVLFNTQNATVDSAGSGSASASASGIL